jgi:hypothetical protein
MDERMSNRLISWELQPDLQSLASKKDVEWLLYGATFGLFNVQAIHVPESTYQGTSVAGTYIDYYTILLHDNKVFNDICVLAEELALLQQKDYVDVVLCAPADLISEGNTNLYKKSLRYMSDTLARFKHIRILIENVAAKPNYAYGSFTEPVSYVHDVIYRYSSKGDFRKRIGVALNTYNIWKSQDVLETKHKDTMFKDYYHEKYSMSAIIHAYSQDLIQIRFGNYNKKSNQGTKFDGYSTEDCNKIMTVIQTLRDIRFNDELVLDVAEDSPASSTNVIETITSLQNLNILKKD